MSRRTITYVALSGGIALAGATVVGCAPSEPGSESPIPLNCSALAAPDFSRFNDYNGQGAVPHNHLHARAESAELAQMDGDSHNAVDGRADTVWRTSVEDSFPHELVIDLERTRLVRGIRYLGSQDQTDDRVVGYTLYVSESPACWEDPVASGSLADTGEPQTISIAGAVGRYVKLRAISSTGDTVAGAAEVDVIVAAGFASTPPEFAIAGALFEYDARADMPNDDRDAVTYSLKQAPPGAALDPSTGHLVWTPLDTEGGNHPITIAATDGDAVARQTFTLPVSVPQVIAEGTVGTAGGTIAVNDPGSPLDGLTITAPPLSQTHTVRVGKVEDLPIDVWEEQIRLQDWLAIVAEPPIPDGTTVSVTVPVRAPLPSGHSFDDINIMQYAEHVAFSYGASYGETVYTQAIDRDEFVRTVRSDLFAARGGLVFTAASQFAHELRSNRFHLIWAADILDGPRPDIAVGMMEFLEELERIATDTERNGCTVPAQTRVYIHRFKPNLAGGFQHKGVLYLNRRFAVAGTSLNPDYVGTLAHEYFHAVQNGYSKLPNRRNWLIEATASYWADHIRDDSNSYRSFGAWTRNVTELPLHAIEGPPLYTHYKRMLLFKHLETAGGFDACALFRDHGVEIATSGIDAVGALDQYLGGRLADRFLSFVAAYDGYRKNDQVDEIEELDLGFITDIYSSFFKRRSIVIMDHPIHGGRSVTYLVLDGSEKDINVQVDVTGTNPRMLGAVFDKSFNEVVRFDETTREFAIPNDRTQGYTISVINANMVNPFDSDLHVRLTATAGPSTTVRGNVVDNHGRPTTRARLYARVANDPNYSRAATPDANGNYEIHGVRADGGAITITAGCDLSSETSQSAAIAPVQSGITNIPPLYLPAGCICDGEGYFECGPPNRQCFTSAARCDGILDCDPEQPTTINADVNEDEFK